MQQPAPLDFTLRQEFTVKGQHDVKGGDSFGGQKSSGFDVHPTGSRSDDSKDSKTQGQQQHINNINNIGIGMGMDMVGAVVQV